MYSLLLAIIYLSFISLGLPDSLLGSAWPVMQVELGAPLSAAGVISMIISFGTTVSSLMSDRLTRKLGTGLVAALSVAFTAVALFGFSISSEFWMLCLWAVPYGLGAGAIDAALNNYVALHYSSRHMSWLHCFWGVGATASPYIMSFCLSSQLGWRVGYRTVSLIQIVLTACLFFSIPLWKKRVSDTDDTGEGMGKALTLPQVLKIKGVPMILLAFFGYCALEVTAGLWAATYLVNSRGINPETAASFASFFFIGITVGRLLNGFIADRFGDKTLIRTGIIIVSFGILMMGLPFMPKAVSLAGFIVIGLGAAPIYPCIIHSTPRNFGAENSQAIVGIQMASAYMGSTLMPPVFGLIAQHINVGLFPVYLAFFAVLMLVMTEWLNLTVAKQRA